MDFKIDSTTSFFKKKFRENAQTIYVINFWIGLQKGVVTILDVLQVCNHSDRDEVNLTEKMAGVVAHFIAHNKAVVAMEFDTNGTLLLTADSVGNYFNLYKIMAHPSGATYSTVHHLYSLYRGETPGSVQDIAFSPDAR